MTDSTKAPFRDHVITDTPMRLRWGDWRTSQIIQVHVSPAAAYEDQRAERLAAGLGTPGNMPVHYCLDQGMRDIALGLLRHRERADKQVQVIYLAALVETLLTAPCPILRTDLIRKVYQEVNLLSNRLGVHFSTSQARFIPPIHDDAQTPDFLARCVANIDNLQNFYCTLQGLAQSRHAILSKRYIIYFPKKIGL
jgi:hypothetical protein